MIGAAFFFTCVMCLHGYAVVTTKKLIETNTIQLNFILGCLILLSSAVMMPSAMADPNYHKPTNIEMLYAFLFTGMPMALGQFIGVSAFIMSKNLGIVTPFQFSNIILGYLVSVLRYDEKINVVCLMGGIAITLGVIFILKYKSPPKK